jgi:predicted RNA-binding Zn ribbon-like protein
MDSDRQIPLADVDGTLPLVGEPLALDLLNTVVRTAHGGVDLLDDPVTLAAWLAAQGERIPQPLRRECPTEVRAVKELRGHVASAVEHARRKERPPRRCLDALTDAQRAAPEYLELGSAGDVVTATPRRAGSYAVRLCAHLAESATELLTSPDIHRVALCAHPDCVMLFLPSHPRRRWCSTRCGNRARVARYYHRHKGG